MSSDVVAFVFRYFAFIACGINLRNLWMVRSKTSRAVKIYLASFSGSFLTWGILQLAGGYRTFFFILLPPNHHPLVAAFWAIYFVSMWASTAWVVWGGGAEDLIRSDVGYGREGSRTSQNVKLFHAAVAILFPVLVILGYATNVFSRTIIDLEQIFPL